MDTTTKTATHDAAPTAEAQAPQKEDKAEMIVRAALQVKVAVYAKGTAAGLGITPKNMAVLHKLYKLLGADGLKARVRKTVDRAIGEAQISYGLDDAAIEDAVVVCMDEIESKRAELVARKIAQGDIPVAGVPAHLEYVFNPDNKPMADVEGVSPTSEKVWLHVVHQGDTLVQYVPAEEGKPGRSVLGESIDPPGGDDDVHLTRVVGANTNIEGSKLVATCEGACEENASGRVRVVPEIVVKNVDALSGNIPEAGTSKASVLVRGDVKKNHTLSTSELAFVGVGEKGGMVEKGAHVMASKLVVNGTIQGVIEENRREQRPAVDVEMLCVARDIDGALLHAGSIMVAGNCRVAALDIDEGIRIDGHVLGGQIVCRQLLAVAGDLGSDDGGSNTRIVIPLDEEASRKAHRLTLQIAKRKKELVSWQEKQQLLENDNSKRAKSDPFWSDLLAGNVRPAKTALEGQTMRQFKDMQNRKKVLGRMIQEIQTDIRNLQTKKAEEEQTLGAQEGVTLSVGGKFYLDASVDVSCGISEEDLDAKVNYTIDGKRFRNHTLRDIQQYLSRQASEYLQAREEAVGARKEAIDKMFEGRDARPTGPTVAHKDFELDFEWAEEGDEPSQDDSPLHVRYTGRLNTRELRKMKILAHMTLREIQKGVEVNVTRNGARPMFGIGRMGKRSSKWQDDAEALKALEEMCIRGLSGKGLLAGLPVPDEKPAVAPVDAPEQVVAEGEEDVIQDKELEGA